jgi:hypothetical protein
MVPLGSECDLQRARTPPRYAGGGVWFQQIVDSCLIRYRTPM